MRNYKICFNCGVRLSKNVNFCDKCLKKMFNSKKVLDWWFGGKEI
jgi:ribosomal protein L40E